MSLVILGHQNPIEVSHQMDTCGATGFNPPTTEDCERFLKKTGKKLEKVPDFVNGIQHWKVSEALQYRKNFGGCVHSLVDLNVYQTLTVSLGQRGETSCQHNPTDPLCARGSGSGGGGASMVFLNDVLILVAGGGGGLLSKGEIDHIEGIPEDISVGGRTHSNESWSHLDEEIKKSKDFIDNSIIMYKNVSGFGVSFKPGHIVKIASNCSDCSMLNGEKKTANGGTCVDSRVEAKGGFGGGGASCGKGAGGGGGFLGGAPGDDTAGWGGSSWSNADAVLQTEFRSGKNNKDGTFMIYACQLKCPQNARCVFETPVDQKMKCTCADGVVVEENELCASDKEPFYRALLFLLIFLCFLFSVGYCCYCLMKRRMRKAQRQKHAYHCEMEARVEARLRANITSELQRLSNDDNNALRFLLEQIEELPKIERSNLLLLEPLGVGAFGEVFKAKMRRDQTTIEVAVKTLPFSSSKQAQDEFFMEAQIMNKFRHDNIVSFFGINFDVTPRYIVLELMKGGDLKSFLRTSRSTKIDPNPNNLLMLDLVSMCLDVAKGCEFLAANKFIHRDIAARNCLLTSQAHDRVVKIGDFGMARDVYRTDYYRKGGRALLPVKWMPPEALLDGYFTTKTDVWSFGILTWEVFSLGYMPYPGRNNMEVLDLISKGGRLEPPIGTPSQIHQIMLQCWKTRVETRPTFTTIIHWLQKLADDPIIRSQPIPDKNLSMPSTAQQTPCVETPRSEITVTTGLNSPSSSKEMLHMNESFGIDTDEFTCVVSSPYVIKNFAQSIPKNSYIQPILEEVGNENGKEDTLITVDSSEQQSCGQQSCGQQICGQQIEQFQDPLSK
ncbi:unnamed protein product, partial [Mesorhabditis belari]|uniref:Tyrosine-protein kinase receptor n=1 Tax=Mesorhabditis belari TaxID=2138241 RepID=A0AAF3J9G1_9BILA